MNTPQRRPARPPQRSTRVIVQSTDSGNAFVYKVLIVILLAGIGGFVCWHHLYNTPAPNVAGQPNSPPDFDIPIIHPPPPAPPPPPPPSTGQGEKSPPAPAKPTRPPLPEFKDFERPDALLDLIAATRARIDDARWAEHKERLHAAALHSIARRSRLAGPTTLENTFSKTALPLALAQLELMNRLGENAFADWARAAKPFARHVLTTAPSLENFLNALTPHDHPPGALKVWAALHAKATTAAERQRYENLVLALALIHDARNGNLSAAERAYAYYVKADARKQLLIDPSQILPDELVWGVAPSRFGYDSLDWAVANIKLPLARLGVAYSMVPYRLHHPPYPSYTMEHIRTIGGVCQQQAEFTEANARAHAVPAAHVGGQSSRGGHAWVALRGKKGWHNGTGRFSSDDFDCGHTRSPQTGRSFREWDFFLYDDPDRTNGNRLNALRLTRAATLLLALQNDTTGHTELLEAAARRNPHDPERWRTWVDALLADKKTRPTDYWQKLVNEYRKLMKKHPDHLDLSDRIEMEKIFPRQDPDRVGEQLRNRRRQLAREHPARHDLLLASIRREVAFYQTRNDTRRIGLLYNNTLRTYGGRLMLYLAIASDFAAAAKDSPEVRHSAILVLEKVFNEKIDTQGKGDAFRLPMEARVCRKLAQVFENDGNERKAARYNKRATEIDALGAQKRDAMQ